MQDANKQVPIGLSFPEYRMGDKFGVLGGKLRLFAQDEPTFIKFNAAKWLSRLSDYVHCTSIRPIQEDKLKGFATYLRLRPKTNAEKLARRYAKRHGIDVETALNADICLDQARKHSDYPMQFRYNELPHAHITTPFIRLKSLSNDHGFCLWIKKTECDHAVPGQFSTYGLSSRTTVPEF
jgi:CRISPR-associated endonuclease Csy4